MKPNFNTEQQGFSAIDRDYRGSSFQEVRDALFANPYYDVWRAGELPVYPVTFASVIRGVFSRRNFHFLNAARRTVKSKADLRWGSDLRGQRRLLHPNGVCLTGLWEIDTESDYSGYFQQGTTGRVIARYSTCCAECRPNRVRSLSMVGKIFPMDETSKVAPAHFVTQEDLGGSTTQCINDAEIRNAPNTTFWRRGWGIPVFLLTGVAFMLSDQEIAQRQLYQIAEFEREKGEQTVTPQFMRLRVSDDQPRIESHLDFRDEVMAHIYDENDPAPKNTLSFDIEVSDMGKTFGALVFQRRVVPVDSWRKIGRLTFSEAVVSYNGDFVVHFHHPAWRNDRNDPETVARVR